MANEGRLTEVLSDLPRTLLADFPIQGILDHLVELIVEVLPVSSAGVALITPAHGAEYIAASDPSALRFERLQADLDEGPCLASFTSGESVAVPDLRVEDERFPRFGPAAVEAGLQAVFAFPLRHSDDRIGALDLYRETRGDLDARDMAVAQTLADVAAAYLLNARAREQARATVEHLQHLVLHDPLTGLPNRVLFDERLAHAAHRAMRSHNTAAVLFADLDRFKAVNDTHGHDVGDELLRAVAERLAAVVRPGDTLARLGGDEFVFLCEDLHDPADLDVITRRIVDAFDEPFVVAGTTLFLSVSVGVAFAGPGEDITDRLMAQADLAMYQAKRRGGAGHHVIDLRDEIGRG